METKGSGNGGEPEPTDVSLQLYRGRPGFDSLHDEWEAFARSHGSHFVHFPAWYGAELRRTGDKRVYFLAVRDTRDELLAVLPLQHCRYPGHPLGLPIVQLYYPNEMGVNDVLSREPLRPHWPSIVRLLRRELPIALLMRWQCVLETGCAVTHGPSPAELRHTHQSKYLHFADGWDAFRAGYSPNFRAGMGKKTRRLERRGQVRVETTSEPSRLPTAFEAFLQVEDSGWKGAMGTSILKQPPVHAYYRHLLAHFGRLGLCRVSLLFIDNTAVAGQFGIEIGSCLYLLKIGFREDYGPYSPGAVLLYKLVQHYCEHGPATTMSFVTSVDWIDRWHPSAVQAGVFYTDCASVLSKAAVRLVRWLKTRSQPQADAAPKEAVEPEAE